MQFLRNRTVIGVICIILSLIICFAVTPLFNRAISEKTEIVRVTKEIRKDEEITADMVETVEVGAYNLPESVITNRNSVVGKFASAELQPGDYILASKVAEEPAAENAYLYNLNGEKQAVSVSVKSFAAGLSGKLQSGDIVSVLAPDYSDIAGNSRAVFGTGRAGSRGRYTSLFGLPRNTGKCCRIRSSPGGRAG